VTINTLTPTLSWTGGSNFSSLQINVSKSPYGAPNIVYTSAWLSAGTTSTTVSLPTWSTDYRWDVTACSGANGTGPCVTSGNAFFSTQAQVGDTINITAGPAANPNPVVSGGQTQLSISATDSLGHALGYSWSGPGTFNNTASASPQWTAPTNTTGAS